MSGTASRTVGGGAAATTTCTKSLEEAVEKLHVSPLPHEEEDELLDADEIIEGITFVDYQDELQLESVMRLVGRDLSEPYSIFTYRYFLHQYPDLCILAVPTHGGGIQTEHPQRQQLPRGEPIGCVVCKIDEEEDSNCGDDELFDNFAKRRGDNNDKLVKVLSGYMAMLAVDASYRRSGIGTALVKRVVRRMRKRGCTSVTLETEVSNKAAMRLYEQRLGFLREELLVRYYLNWGDAYRLRLWLDDDDVPSEKSQHDRRGNNDDIVARVDS